MTQATWTAGALARILGSGLLLWTACTATPIATPAWALEELKPKFGPDAVPITRSSEYVRTAAAPDYWALSPYYVPQTTGASCSLASVTMMLNALRGLPALASERLVTGRQLLDRLDDDHWRAATADDGEGVSFGELIDYVRRSLAAYNIDAEVEVWRPRDASPATLAELRRILAGNERSADDIILLAFDQGTLTGDVGVGHVAPLGAYDAATKRALVMDPDRTWYVPYWTSDARLLDAMLKPDRADPEGSGLIRVRSRRVSG
ncbi:phytochelatin synthase family protein [Azospirillum sp. B2RO_4]|uniref:phytochelatin synthase family protein n=1 Tax=Azospirillum sp. B2RO_4 TaxID=3027796 RepID=UPI003DA8FB97